MNLIVTRCAENKNMGWMDCVVSLEYNLDVCVLAELVESSTMKSTKQFLPNDVNHS